MIDAITDLELDKDQIYLILRELPSMIDMKILFGPVVVKGHPENPGWTGFTIIDKSHISIHTFAEGNKVSIDVYSCKPFEIRNVVDYINSKIKLTKMNYKTLERSES